MSAGETSRSLHKKRIPLSMYKSIVFIISIIISCGSLELSSQANSAKLVWDEIGEMPPANGQATQPGVAGAFMGISNGALIIAGGANFPLDPPWQGGPKVYHDQIYVLDGINSQDQQWVQSSKLNSPVAYGLSIGFDNELICIGGSDGNADLAEVYSLRWDHRQKKILTKELPKLPFALANASGGAINNTIYIAGTDNVNASKHFLSIDISQPAGGWKRLEPWPGVERSYAMGAVQSNGDYPCFYLFKGRRKTSGGKSEFLSDGLEYDPRLDAWRTLQDKQGPKQLPLGLSAGTVVPYGANHILLFGGDNGAVFSQLESLENKIQAETDPNKRQKFLDEKTLKMKSHPGFSKDIWAFHTITESWTKLGELPSGSQVTTTAIIEDDNILIPSGEIAPGVRTPKIIQGNISHKANFGILNYCILFVYLLSLVWLGYHFSKKQLTTHDYFKGGSRIPAWAAGLSIFGTQLSAITFMTIPAKTFATDWLYFFLMMTIVMISPFVVKFFLPFYRRYNLTTAYEYLEHRFDLVTRWLGSIMYILLQFGRLAIVLLLPSLALSVVTGIEVHWCILTMGILSILYTVLGGIEAVIWTDVIQVFVLLGGALIALIILYLDLGIETITHEIGVYDKLKILDTNLSFNSPTLWVVLLGGFASNLIQYGSDQTVVQRYLTTKSEKDAAKSIYLGAWMTLPSALIFFTLGSLLFVFYKSNPEALSIHLEKTDTIFPWYIVNELPDGLSGLLIAAIFAASMSSLDSSMNSVSTVVVTDFIKRLSSTLGDKLYLRYARIITFIVGIIGTAIALIMASWGISSLWDQFNMILGLFVGGLGGIFILGIFTTRANGLGAIVGLVGSGIIQFFIKSQTDIHLLLYAFTGALSSFLIGYLVSLLSTKPTKEKLEWTYYFVPK